MPITRSTVLFVCTGNVCRSPMAAALLAARMPELAVVSAGLHAPVGQRADPHVRALLARRGITLDLHYARPMTSALGLRADLILVMEACQRRELHARWPVLTGRVFCLAPPGETDIDDPYRCGLPAFEQALTRIDAALDWWITRLDALAADAAPAP